MREWRGMAGYSSWCEKLEYSSAGVSKVDKGVGFFVAGGEGNWQLNAAWAGSVSPGSRGRDRRGVEAGPRIRCGGEFFAACRGLGCGNVLSELLFFGNDVTDARTWLVYSLADYDKNLEFVRADINTSNKMPLKESRYAVK